MPLAFLSPYGFDVQLIGQILEQLPADIAGWVTVACGLAAYAALLARLDPTRKVRAIAPAPPARALEPGTDWQKIMDVSLVELIRTPDLNSIRADAALQIDAAEHAFNRMLAECAKVTSLVVMPTFEPTRRLAHEPLKAPERQQPLAA